MQTLKLIPTLATAAFVAAASLPAQVFYVSGTYEQNFDTLASTGTGTTNVFTDNTTLQGWYAQAIDTLYSGSGTFTFTMTGTLNNHADDYSASDGSSTGGDFYSYGSTGSTERALGSLGSSSSDDFFFGLRVQNDTGLPIVRFTLTYDGEQWRRGGNSPQRPEALLFFYRVGGTEFIGSTGWTEVPELKFTSPNAAAADTAATALDGNATGKKVTGITKEVILSTPLAPGESLWLTWVDVDNAGTDHGLAIDNVVFSAVTSSGSDVSRGAGTLFTPTSFGGNSFTVDDTAVFDGTAATVTLSGHVEAAGLKFTTSGYIVTGTASDSLAVSGPIQVDSGADATISGILSGDEGLTKTGAGTLTLFGANTFAGAVSINAGTVVISSDSAFGAPENDVSLTGSLITSSASLSFGSGRSFSGSGTIQTASPGTLTFGGPVAAGALIMAGPSTINFNGATNSVGSIALPVPTAINVTGGALTLGDLTLSQTSGTTTITGPVALSSGDKLFPVPGGSLVFSGAVNNGSTRLQKTGAGTLDLTSATVTGAGTLRIGVVSSDLVNQGGLVIVDEGSDLGTTQMHFNSGVLQATAPIVSTAGVSIGGRRSYDEDLSSVLPVPTFTGADITLTGASSFFNSPSAPTTDEAIAVNVNNTTRLNGTFAVGTVGQWVMLGGSGTLVFGGNASALAANFLTADTVTIQVDGQVGGGIIEVSPNTTLTGSGALTGLVTTTTTGTPPTTTVTYHSESLVYIRGGTLAPTGLLTVNAGLTLAGTTELSIAGLTRGTEYDSVALINPDAAGSFSFTLTYGGALKLDFPETALSGTYTLFEIGASNVSRSGTFSSVVLTGSHDGPLTAAGAVWSGTVGGVTFSFDESTGVLTVTGGAEAHTELETWRFEKFGVYTDTAEVLAGDTEDFDGDGIANLLEYATGGDPTVAGVSLVAQGKSGDFLTLSFPVIDDSSLTYTVQASGDLGSAFTTATGSTNTVGGVTTYTDNVSLATPGVRRFLRLQVTVAE